MTATAVETPEADEPLPSERLEAITLASRAVSKAYHEIEVEAQAAAQRAYSNTMTLRGAEITLMQAQLHQITAEAYRAGCSYDEVQQAFSLANVA